MKRFLNAQHDFVSFYKSKEKDLELEINITDCSAEFNTQIQSATGCEGFLCFKISQHIVDRKVLYVYFVCEKVRYNKVFCGYNYVTVEGSSITEGPVGPVSLELNDIKNKILEFFKEDK